MPDDVAEETRGRVRLPAVVRSPVWELSRRVLLAIAILGLTVALVYFDRVGYRDNAHPGRELTLTDAIYYTTVTLSTTGYGDIAPVEPHTRLINAFVLTPLRIAFLVLLIGTTLEVLANQGREMFRVSRWRKTMDDHVIVIGYGTKGRSAVDTLVSNGVDKDRIVVVDPSSTALGEAHADGLAVVTGDATRREVLRRAGVARAKQVIITTDRDDSTVLATLNVRQLNPDTYVVAAVRESDNVQLVRQSGADSVVTSSDAVGRLLGLSSLSPSLGSVMEDLMTYGAGARGRRARPAGPGGRQAAAVAARPGDRGRAGRRRPPLLRPDRDPARARRPAGRRTPGRGAALGASPRHARRDDLGRGGVGHSQPASASSGVAVTVNDRLMPVSESSRSMRLSSQTIRRAPSRPAAFLPAPTITPSPVESMNVTLRRSITSRVQPAASTSLSASRRRGAPPRSISPSAVMMPFPSEARCTSTRMPDPAFCERPGRCLTEETRLWCRWP